MAYVVSSFTLSMHLRPSQTLEMEMHPRRSALGRLSRPATSKMAIGFVAPKCSSKSSSKGVSLVVRSCDCHGMNLSRHVCGSVSHCFNVSSSYTVISGFWVGPDVEDGWGFVEAFVNKIF